MLVFRISRVRLEHGGKYTCGPTTGIADTVMVHVIAGMQSGILEVSTIFHKIGRRLLIAHLIVRDLLFQ